MVAERENITFFETLPTNDRSRVDFGTVRGTQFGAAVRVLRRLCGLRRDALPQAASQLFGDRADDRQRDRLLVDLRRQPAHHSLDHRRGRAGSGLVELAVRGQRGVRARLPVGQRRARAAGPATPRRVARRPRHRARRRHSGGTAAAGVRSRAPSGSGWPSSTPPRQPRSRRDR